MPWSPQMHGCCWNHCAYMQGLTLSILSLTQASGDLIAKQSSPTVSRHKRTTLWSHCKTTEQARLRDYILQSVMSQMSSILCTWASAGMPYKYDSMPAGQSWRASYSMVVLLLHWRMAWLGGSS